MFYDICTDWQFSTIQNEWYSKRMLEYTNQTGQWIMPLNTYIKLVKDCKLFTQVEKIIAVNNCKYNLLTQYYLALEFNIELTSPWVEFIKPFIEESDMRFYTEETNKIIAQYFPGAEEIKNQRKGSAADYILPNGEVIEVKLDYRASQTGNIYVEFEYIKDGQVRPSGLALSADRGYTAVIVILTKEKVLKILKMSAKDLINKCINDKMKIVETGQRANGNRPGVSSRGYLLPITKCLEEWSFLC